MNDTPDPDHATRASVENISAAFFRRATVPAHPSPVRGFFQGASLAARTWTGAMTSHHLGAQPTVGLISLRCCFCERIQW